MPSLSRTSGGDGVAERLLVPEHEPRAGHAVRGPDDPLEAGERLRVTDSGRRRDLGQHGATRPRSSRPAGRPAPGRWPVSSRYAPSSAPTWSPVRARQPPGAAASGTATASRSPSGSLAMTRSAPVSRASARARSSAPGSSGLGNATVGNAGIRLGLRGDHVRRREPGPLEGPQRQAGRHAVQRRVDRRAGRRRRARSGQPGRSPGPQGRDRGHDGVQVRRGPSRRRACRSAGCPRARPGPRTGRQVPAMAVPICLSTGGMICAPSPR